MTNITRHVSAMLTPAPVSKPAALVHLSAIFPTMPIDPADVEVDDPDAGVWLVPVPTPVWEEAEATGFATRRSADGAGDLAIDIEVG